MKYNSPFLDVDSIFIASIESINLKKIKIPNKVLVKPIENDEWIETPIILIKCFNDHATADDWIEKTEHEIKKKHIELFKYKYSNIRGVPDFISDMYKTYPYHIAKSYIEKMFKQIDNHFYKRDNIWIQ